MRKSIIYISTAILAFVVGVIAYISFLTPPTPSIQSEPFTVSLCDLERNFTQYDGSVVRLKVTVANYSRGGVPFTYDWSCGGQHSYNYPLIDVRGFDGLSPDLQRLLENTRSVRTDTNGERIRAEIVVVGIFDADYVDPMGYAFAHHFRLIPRSIEQLTPISSQR